MRDREREIANVVFSFFLHHLLHLVVWCRASEDTNLLVLSRRISFGISVRASHPFRKLVFFGISAEKCTQTYTDTHTNTRNENEK